MAPISFFPFATHFKQSSLNDFEPSAPISVIALRSSRECVWDNLVTSLTRLVSNRHHRTTPTSHITFPSSSSLRLHLQYLHASPLKSLHAHVACLGRRMTPSRMTPRLVPLQVPTGTSTQQLREHANSFSSPRLHLCCSSRGWGTRNGGSWYMLCRL